MRRWRYYLFRGDAAVWKWVRRVRPSVFVEATLKESSTQADLLIVGGGINGVGIARDAAGRGLRAILVEQGDLGSATSSASSKLIHGGLRYLEQLEFKLVAEALSEREVLLNAAPHIVQPMRFVMPHARDLRPGWMIRAGLFLYDWLARRQTLAPSQRADLAAPPYAGAFKPGYTKGYAYSDCWVDDARLVIANARAAAETGAAILPRTKCLSATRSGGLWRATLAGNGGETHVAARALVNAAGPWVDRFLAQTLAKPAQPRAKLVQGSHIVVPRLYEGSHACLLQNDDRRVVFVYPYESRYTLVGTTDVELPGEPASCGATPEEIAYLCRAANRYFLRTIDPGDVKWSFCGVRALVDDGSRNPSQLIRDYLLRLRRAGRSAATVGFRRQDHHLSQACRTRAGETGTLVPRGRRAVDGDRPAARRRNSGRRSHRLFGRAGSTLSDVTAAARRRARTPAWLACSRRPRRRKGDSRSRPALRWRSLWTRSRLFPGAGVGAQRRGRAVAANQSGSASRFGATGGFVPLHDGASRRPYEIIPRCH